MSRFGIRNFLSVLFLFSGLGGLRGRGLELVILIFGYTHIYGNLLTGRSVLYYYGATCIVEQVKLVTIKIKYNILIHATEAAAAAQYSVEGRIIYGILQSNIVTGLKSKKGE